MHDRAVRRRRAVLAVLVAASLILLTAYFGEPAGGALHAVQRGAMSVLAPIQEGANRAVKPIRDLFGWFGDTLDAKSQRDELKGERDRYRQELAQSQVQLREAQQQAGLRQVDTAGGLSRYQPVDAQVYERSPNTWYQTVVINKGSSDGIRREDPVVNAEGLVGRVKDVSGGSAVVTLLTDQDFGVSAMVANGGEPGNIGPAVGAPTDLLFDLVDNAANVRTGDLIVTAGTQSARLQSPFPRGIVIGTVKRIDVGEGRLDRRIHVAPAADLHRLDLVQVLTAPHADLRAQAAP
jgi:rod shape-determining protein MreC